VRVEAGYPQARFDIKLLTQRLEAATTWLATKPRTRSLRLGYLTEETATAAALNVTANLNPQIKVIVSCSGRPDVAFSCQWFNRHLRAKSTMRQISCK
jgi:hypothetical protein